MQTDIILTSRHFAKWRKTEKIVNNYFKEDLLKMSHILSSVYNDIYLFITLRNSKLMFQQDKWLPFVLVEEFTDKVFAILGYVLPNLVIEVKVDIVDVVECLLVVISSKRRIATQSGDN